MKTTLLIFLATTLISTASALAQGMDHMQHMDEQAHREMMPKHEMMKQMQKVQDDEIDKLAARMNAAQGDERIDATVAVINKLIEQRKAMHDKMAAMHD